MDYELISSLGWIPSLIGLYFIWKQAKDTNKQMKISNKQTEISIEQIKNSIEQMQISTEQTKAAINQNKMQRDNTKREHALKMTKYFMMLCENEISIVSDIYRKARINELYKTIDHYQLKHFDKYEMMKVLGCDIDSMKLRYQTEIENNYSILWDTYLDHFYESIDNSIINQYLHYSKNSWNEENIIKYKDDLNSSKSDEQLKSEMNIMKRELLDLYRRNRDVLLNKLEYFAMHFICELADEELVYQSLHQSYLSIVKILYGWIVIKNDTEEKDRYYTNVIELYKIWATRYTASMNNRILKERENVIKVHYDSDYGIKEE